MSEELELAKKEAEEAELKALADYEVKVKEEEMTKKKKEEEAEVIQKEEAEVIQKEEPSKVRIYLEGKSIEVTMAQLSKYQEYLLKLEEVHAGRLISEIPHSDPYWALKGQIDAFISNLKG